MSTLWWIVYANAIAAFIGIATLCAESVLRASGKTLRCVWLAAMTASLLLLVVAAEWQQPVHTPNNVPGNAIVTEPVRPTESTLASGSGGMRSAAEPSAVSVPRVDLSNAPHGTTSDGAWERWAILASLLFVPALVIVEQLKLLRRRRSWHEGFMDGESVLIAPDFGPAIVGVFRPRIVVPAYALELAFEQRRLLLLHEQEHLRAHDGQFAMLALAHVALCPWNVALWWQYVRLRLAIELDCDRRVLRLHDDARGYGTLLLDVAARAISVPLHATAFVEGRNSLRH